MDLNIQFDKDTGSRLFFDLIVDVLAGQQLILDRLAEQDAYNLSKTKEEMLDLYSSVRSGCREMILESLFSSFGPDLSKEAGL